jgi:hypothetical protein
MMNPFVEARVEVARPAPRARAARRLRVWWLVFIF